MRGFGESGGTRGDFKRMPEDVDGALEFLMSQPRVDRQVIGLGGAGWLGVTYAVEAARRHPKDIKSLVLMSGETGRDGLQFLHQTPQLPELFVFSDEDEYPPTQDAMKLLYVTASSPSKKLVHYSAAEDAPWLWYETSDVSKVPAHGGHGTDMFQVHPELPGIIVHWFVSTLIKTPGHAPADSLAAASLSESTSEPRRSGAGKAATSRSSKKDPQVQLWPEVAIEDGDSSKSFFRLTSEKVDSIVIIVQSTLLYRAYNVARFAGKNSLDQLSACEVGDCVVPRCHHQRLVFARAFQVFQK